MRLRGSLKDDGQSNKRGITPMSIRTVAEVKTKELSDLALGDKLLTDIIGRKGRVLINRNTVISTREILWLKKKIGESKPRLSSQFYVIGEKAKLAVRDKDGNILVKPNAEIVRDAVKPLLDEGFSEVEIPGGRVMISKKEVWPDKEKWHICEFNPFAHVETTSIVNEDGRKPELNTEKKAAKSDKKKDSTPGA